MPLINLKPRINTSVSDVDAAIEIYKRQIDSPTVDIYTRVALGCGTLPV